MKFILKKIKKSLCYVFSVVKSIGGECIQRSLTLRTENSLTGPSIGKIAQSYAYRNRNFDNIFAFFLTVGLVY